MKQRIIIFLCLALFPIVSFAQENATTASGQSGIDTLIYNINRLIINPAIATLFIVAFVIFLWGLVEFLRKATDKEGRQIGKQHMLWGIVGFVIMLGVYGIINILLSTFNIEGPSINQQEQKFIAPTLPDIIIK